MKTLAQPSSLSSLYHGDTDRNTNILLPYPSSIGKFPNTKFTIHDGSTPKNKVSHKTLAKKEAWRNAALLGDGIPGITTETPPKQLVQYWKDQFGFSYENLLTLSPGTVCDEINQGEAKMITLYPYDHIDAEKHAVEPQNHHKILSKKALLEMGIPTPETKVVSIPQTGINTIKWPLPIPFVIKTTHGLSGDGTYIIKTPKDLEKTKQTLHEYHTNYKLDQILCQKLVENEKVNYCVQAYVSKDGTIKPLGFTQQGTDQEVELPITKNGK
jgi:hypothetical protein